MQVLALCDEDAPLGLQTALSLNALMVFPCCASPRKRETAREKPLASVLVRTLFISQLFFTLMKCLPQLTPQAEQSTQLTV
jgi:hypothetical protein